MFVHQLAYAPDDSGVWILKAINGVARRFSSRVAALNFAMRDAAERALPGVAGVISVQGADGVWRSFDSGMKGMPLPAARHG
jgi:hypothetical protein